MSDKKMLRAIINGQSSIREDIRKVEKKLSKKIEGVENKLSKKIEVNTKRLDKLGLDLAALSEDSPTIEEFDELKERVDKVETQIASV